MYSVRPPPSSTPAAPPLPATAPHTPRALLRSEPSRNVVVTIDRAAGERSAAPRPCTARAAISQLSDCAKPPSKDASANRTRPLMKTRRRPSRSAMRPPSSRKPPKVSTYAFTTHGRLVREKSSARPIEGSATFTIEASRTTTNWAMHSRINAIQRRCSRTWCSAMTSPFACVPPGRGDNLYKYGIGVPLPTVWQYTESRLRLSVGDTGHTGSRKSDMTTPPTTTPAPEQKQMRADARRNRERVLVAARQCFARSGLDAQVDDIARAAEVGVGTVYRHFPTKEALAEAIAADHFDRLAASAREALENPDPWEAFSTFLRSSAQVQAGDRAL